MKKKPKHKSKSKKPRVPTNILALKPPCPAGCFESQDDAMEAGKALMADMNKVFKKHNIGASFAGGLLPLVFWDDAPTPEQPLRKAWKIQNCLAVKSTSKAMDPDAPTLQGILNGAAGRIYGPAPAAPDVRPS